MRIVVPVKYVPDVHADRRFVDGRLVRDPAEGTLNELDENAVEAALRVVEGLPENERAESEIVAITMGPEAADGALRKAFQLGVDRGIRLTDDALAGSDYFATAAGLGRMVEHLAAQTPVDLVIAGMTALDGQGSVIPALLGAQLGWPALLLAAELTLDEAAKRATATREVDGVTEVLEAPLPAVVSVTDHANDPRMPNFRLIMAARTKTIEAWSLADLPSGTRDDAAEVFAPRTRVLSAAPHPPRPEPEVVVDKGEGGIALAEFLIRNELV